MTNKIGELLLKPIISALIGQDQLQFYETINWQKQSERFRQTNLIYPDYYSQQNFHGIQGGYLNTVAAITYDTVTAYPYSRLRLYLDFSIAKLGKWLILLYRKMYLKIVQSPGTKGIFRFSQQTVREVFLP
ncbi:hypothetical protein [Coleofasciculus sp. G2-EDA-02]|uniref:hypothetical protein n=1 Tax=Coleofasciculus sp. G2-EDA-02 TaxID=3069529 RepID=UPI0033024572